MGRIVGFRYGVVAYVFFFATFLYAIAFVGDIVVSESIDIGKTTPFAKRCSSTLCFSAFSLSNIV